MAPARPVGDDGQVSDDARRPDEPDAELQPPAAGLSDQARLVLAVVLSCALVAAVVTGIVVSVRYVEGNDSTTSKVDTSLSNELKARDDVQSAVSAFVANLNSYSVDDIDGYKKRLTPLLTSGFAESFGLAVDNIVTQVKATDMTSDGKILKTAVSNLDRDSATALVVADAHVTSALGERQRHFRWKVSLVNTDGDWLIDDFKPVE
ncbi:MAG: hypothetical protein ABJA81_10135 [Nocardioidaceae bacterium]